MAIIKMSVLLCLLLVIPAPRGVVAAIDYVARPPDCANKCGNVTVPFPFGLEERCALNSKLWLNCSNGSSGNNTELQLFNIPVHNIFLENATMVVGIYPSVDCYNAGGKRTNLSEWNIRLGQDWPYTFSNTRNKFTVMGCDTYGLMTDDRGTFGSGCISICDHGVNFTTEAACAGMGCCQTSVPKGLKMLKINIGSYNNHSYVSDFNLCGMAFVVDAESFNVSELKLPTTDDISALKTLVLDWVVDHLPCEQAMSNSTYACKENSDCHDYDNGGGYRCFCRGGYEGNPYLPNGCQDIDECGDPDKYPCHGTCTNKPGNYTCRCPFGMEGDGKVDCKISRITIIAAVIATIVFCITLGALIWVLWKRRTREKNFERNGGYLLKNQVKIFAESQIRKATKDFSEKIGEDNLCSVYKGMMLEADVINPVTVRKARDEVTDKRKVRDVGASSLNGEFHDEIKIVSQINHKNVVKLLGVCLETKVPMLVHEYISKGSLHDLIYDQAHWHVFGLWENRLRIAFEMASTLQYLHALANPPVIHGDIKPKNILLDDGYTVKISDFRASSLILPGKTSAAVGGAKGDMAYLDPEYLQTNTLTAKSDVYSFGVILVELLTGFEPSNKDNPVIQPFMSAVEQKTLSRMISIMENVDGNEKEDIVAVAEIAKNCLSQSSEKRPEMKDVADQLSWIKKNSRAYHQEGIEATIPEAKPRTC